MYFLLLALLGEIEFKVESSPLPETHYEFKVEKGELPKFEIKEDQKHVDPPIEDDNLGPAKKVPKKEVAKNRILVYSKVSLERLKKGSMECPPCLAAYVASKNVPEIGDDFDFEFTTKFPDWAEKLGQEPILHWQTCPNGKSKGSWVHRVGWTSPESFLRSWDIAEGKIESPKAKPKQIAQARMSVGRYTWPGNTPSSLKRHLEGRDGSEHRLNTSGMSYSDMLYEHDKWHTIHGPR